MYSFDKKLVAMNVLLPLQRVTGHFTTRIYYWLFFTFLFLGACKSTDCGCPMAVDIPSSENSEIILFKDASALSR